MEEIRNKIKNTCSNNYKKWIVSIVEVVLLTIITILFVSIVYKIWERDIRVPIVFDGDGLGAAMTIRNLIDGNGIFEYPRLSAPYAENIYLQDNFLQLLIVKILILFSKDVGLVTNLYWLLTYLLTSYTMYWFCRKMRLKRVVSFSCAIVYNFLPYHYFRTAHFWLFGCYLIPLVSWVIIYIAEKENDKPDKKAWIKVILFSFLLGMSSIYYSLFYLILVLAAGTYSFFHDKKGQAIKEVLCAVVSNVIAIFLVDILPCVINSSSTISETASQRALGNVYVYSLNFIYLFLPIPGHRIPFFSNITIDIFEQLGMNTEGYMIMLGLAMSVGCVASICALFFTKDEGRLRILGMLVLVSVLVSTIGGLDVFIGYFISSSVRCYNRYSVFIAVFSCLAFGMIIDKIELKKKMLQYLLISIITIGAVFDQTSACFSQYASYNILSKEYVYDYEETEDIYYVIDDFIDKVENMIEDDTMVFQLPIVSTSNGGIELEYQQIQSYICSEKIRWSTNAVAIGKQYKMLQKIGNFSYDQMIDSLIVEGFTGILIDRTEYTNEEFLVLDNKLQEVSNGKTIDSSNGWLRFYYFEEYAQERMLNFTDADISNIKHYLESDSTINQVGFNDLQYSDGKNRKVNSNGQIVIDKGILQYGPYIYLEEGDYIVVIHGSGLDTAEVRCTSGNGACEEKVDIISQENEEIVYRIYMDEGKAGVEFLLNNMVEDVYLSSYHYFLSKEDVDYKILMEGLEKLNEWN